MAKQKLFEDLQRRGFRLFHRHAVCSQEPQAAEELLLRQLDYAGNERCNGGYRQLMLGAKRLADYPLRC